MIERTRQGRANPGDIRVGHRREQRQGDDAPADVFGMRKIAVLPAELAVEGEQVQRRVVHADADAAFLHGRDEGAAVGASGQQRLEHVPVGIREVGRGQAEAEGWLTEANIPDLVRTFKGLSATNAAEVWKVATQDEKKLLFPAYSKKLQNQAGKVAAGKVAASK